MNRTRLACVAIVLFLGAFFPHLSQTLSASMFADSLHQFLQKHLHDAEEPDDKTTEYFAFRVDLNGDGKDEFIVYYTGRTWCGTGGCPTLIIARLGSTYRIVTD